jgi:hypothetical protein
MQSRGVKYGFHYVIFPIFLFFFLFLLCPDIMLSLRHFGVIMALSYQFMIFYDVTSCNVVDIYQRFRDPIVLLFYYKCEAAGSAETSVSIY